MIDIKFIPTGHIFSLSDEEANRIVKEDRGNYEVVKGKIKEEKAPKTSKSVQELVVVNDKNKQTETKTNNKNSDKSKDKEQKDGTKAKKQEETETENK